MRAVLICLLGVMLDATGVYAVGPVVVSQLDFPSKFLHHGTNVKNMTLLMQKHFDISLDYLLASKQYGSQYFQRSGMSKVLAEASDRHWEEGMDVLKMYLELGGNTTNPLFFNNIVFNGQSDLHNRQETPQVKYLGTLKTIMTNSRDLITNITDLHHVSTYRSHSHGDANMAHFLQEKAEKELQVARQMAGHYVTLQKMYSLGVALEMFDNNL